MFSTDLFVIADERGGKDAGATLRERIASAFFVGREDELELDAEGQAGLCLVGLEPNMMDALGIEVVTVTAAWLPL